MLHEARGEEAPWVVAQDMERRPRPKVHLIAFANEKGGVGKSTLAFQTALALSHAGGRVLAIDCDHRQLTLDALLDARDATARTLGVPLPRPRHAPLRQPSAAMLLQEIERLRGDAQFVLLDLPGHDSPLTRRVVTLADTLVTPVNCSQADLTVLGSVSPTDGRLRGIGAFGQTVAALRRERVARGLGDFDWVVAPNRVRQCERRLIAAVGRDLATIGERLGFRSIAGLAERVAYRDLLPFGLCHLDLRLIPGLAAPGGESLKEVRKLIADLQLPVPVSPARATQGEGPRRAAPVPPATAERYRAALAGTRPLATADA